MKPEKQLELLCEHYLLQHNVALTMWDAYTAHRRRPGDLVLYALLEHELAKDQLAAFWPRFHPHYCRALRLKNGEK